MSEKPRAPRKSPTRALASEHRGQATEQTGSGNSDQNHAAIQEELARTRQELEKALRISRTLARTCARAEQETRRCEEAFTLVRRHGSDLVFRLSRDGRIQEVSAASLELMGAAPEALQGRLFQDFVGREDLLALQRYFQAVLQDPEAERQGLVIHLHRDRTMRTLEIHCHAVPHPQTQILEILGIARPWRTPVASSVTDLAFSLAHELNQPLTALAIAARACSQLARIESVDRDELTQAIDQLAFQAERAGELVRRMRQLAVRGEPYRELVNVTELAQVALRMLQADLHREHIRTKLHVAEAIPIIKIDRIQLEQVLVNLIRNAMEAMSQTPADKRLLTVTISRSESEVVLAVADTGRGLSPDIAECLFQPYQTTKPNGMGLGLAVSRAILQAHAGRLWIEPAHGPGATFCFALPLLPRES